VAALCETILQSHAGGIELLPAVPTELGTGQVHGLVARPGILVGLRWRDGALVEAVLRARTGSAAGPRRIRHRDAVITRDIRTGRDTRLTAADFMPAAGA